MKYPIPRGTFDILPESSYKWNYIESLFKDIAERYNYRRITTPIFERTELFERSVGNTSDIVEKEMYKFQDKKGRNFALRPEGTAGVVRSLVDNALASQGSLAMLWYMGPMFRYDRPQKGRYRQFYQYGIENIGSHHPFIDAEVISIGWVLLKTLGLKGFELQINSLGDDTDSAVYDAALISYFTPYKKSLCQDCLNRLERNPKRLLDCKVSTCKEIAAQAPNILEFLSDDNQQHFHLVQRYLKLMNIPFIINPRIVRGLDYYTHTAFEFVTDSLGTQNTLLGGGRYNKLVEQMGGKPMPGIGFAGGFERLMMVMEQEGCSFGKKPLPQAYFIVAGDVAQEPAIKLMQSLREQGIALTWNPDKISFKAQMKSADKSGATWTLIIGEDEVAASTVTIRNMETGKQQAVSISDTDIIAEYILNNK
ncbi:MAG: histidine--tRNA ligase [Candidatus Cloacimonetes bacterium]|nr:histidine--tRNA ligase [Candidatus Cloacimonadota bacterium]